MATGTTITDVGRTIILNRLYSSSPTKTIPDYFKVGISNATPSTGSTDLDVPVPITAGTVNDTCEDAFTGSGGGSNTTDNTSIFKEGAVTSDDTAQNLITNTASATKTWTITPDTNFTGTYMFGCWLYIADATTLAYFLSSGTCLEIRFGSDASNYYSLTYTAADLSTGWNWIHSGGQAINALTETGTVTGNIDTLVVVITTNNATDSWSSGDVIVDLFRTYQSSDLIKQAETNYPSLDTTNFEATTRFRLGPNEASGFSINSIGVFNSDGEMFAEITMEANDKTDNDEFIIIPVDRIL